MPWTTVAILGEFPLLWSTLKAKEFCHADCWKRYSNLDFDTKGFLGGHVHFDTVKQAWTMPPKLAK